MLLNCWLIMVSGRLKLRVYCRKAAMLPKSMWPPITRTAPTSATSAYWIWLRFPMMGMRMLAKVFARVPASQRASFSRSNSSFTADSWLKTCTTFCPSIISSI